MHARMLLARTALTLTLSGASVSAVSAQSTSFGVLLGGVAAKVTEVDVSSADFFNGASTIKNRMGFQAGVYVNRAFNKTFSIQPELHYIQKGTVFDIGGTNAADKLTIDLTYAEVPVLLRADFGSSAWRPFVTAGPTFAMRIGCTGSIEASGSSLSVDCEEFEDNGVKKDPFEKMDIGANVGAGIAGTLGGNKVLMQLRYGRGLTSIITDDAAASAAKTPKNSVISLVFGIGR